MPNTGWICIVGEKNFRSKFSLLLYCANAKQFYKIFVIGNSNEFAAKSTEKESGTYYYFLELCDVGAVDHYLNIFNLSLVIINYQFFIDTVLFSLKETS